MGEKKYKVTSLTFDGRGCLLCVNFGFGPNPHMEMTKYEILSFAHSEGDDECQSTSTDAQPVTP